mmetsp:Transcript_96978/g.175230  ORF Transcript_96978/g.175230 Transcript_96978/m.175230 type:complete len:434 (+) Transcript_96978:70-1371(+)
MGCGSSVEFQSACWRRGSFQDCYSVKQKLGEGSYGQVRAIIRQADGAKFAVKILDTRKDNQHLIDKDRRNIVDNEIRLWRSVGRDEHIVDFVESFWGSHGLVYIVMERCCGSLTDMLCRTNTVGISELARIFKAMLLGINKLHSLRICHRDIKPDNYLVDASWTVKLADFGLACKMPRKGIEGVYGTPPYMSPQCCGLQTYGLKTDVWSYGVTVYVILFGVLPYGGDDVVFDEGDMMWAIEDGSILPTFKRPLGPQPARSAVTFAKALLVRSEEQRPSACHALRLPFLDGGLTGLSVLQEPKVPLFGDGAKDQCCEAWRRPLDPWVRKKLDEIVAKIQAEEDKKYPERQMGYFAVVESERLGFSSWMPEVLSNTCRQCERSFTAPAKAASDLYSTGLSTGTDVEATRTRFARAISPPGEQDLPCRIFPLDEMS